MSCLTNDNESVIINHCHQAKYDVPRKLNAKVKKKRNAKIISKKKKEDIIKMKKVQNPMLFRHKQTFVL
jgi:hypothetical protein